MPPSPPAHGERASSQGNDKTARSPAEMGRERDDDGLPGRADAQTMTRAQRFRTMHRFIHDCFLRVSGQKHGVPKIMFSYFRTAKGTNRVSQANTPSMALKQRTPAKTFLQALEEERRSDESVKDTLNRALQAVGSVLQIVDCDLTRDEERDCHVGCIEIKDVGKAKATAKPSSPSPRDDSSQEESRSSIEKVSRDASGKEREVDEAEDERAVATSPAALRRDISQEQTGSAPEAARAPATSEEPRSGLYLRPDEIKRIMRVCDTPGARTEVLDLKRKNRSLKHQMKRLRTEEMQNREERKIWFRKYTALAAKLKRRNVHVDVHSLDDSDHDSYISSYSDVRL